MERQRKRRLKGRFKTAKTAGVIFLIIVGLFIIIQAASGLYPFGDKSNLLWDEEIQYVDYFAFYRDVLLGKASITYSFSKSLGGSLAALFGYYLGCPLNLLVVFFRNEQLPAFLFGLTAAKLGLGGVTVWFFIRRRFSQLSLLMSGMLSVAYGLSQYSMLQLSNIMFLDGMILLPLLLLAVYEFVSKEKKLWLFMAVLFSIAINWYTGYMIGLFSALYYFYERMLKAEKFTWTEIKAFVRDTIRCGCTMVFGLLGSCLVFYPIFKGLQNGKTALDFSIFYYDTYGSFLDIFRGFALGSIVPTVSLYCGLLFLGFFFYYFFARKIPVKEKILSLAAVLFMFASCWLLPLDHIWSGMRSAESYRFRYSFLVVFLVVYLAAKGALAYEERKSSKAMAGIYGGCLILFLFLQHLAPFEKEKNFVYTLGFLAVYVLMFLLIGKFKKLKSALPIFLGIELAINGIFTFIPNYAHNQSIQVYLDYAKGTIEQTEAVKNQEEEPFYRMDSLEKRNDPGDGCSAYLNEPMAYNYAGMAHYSSTYDSDANRLVFDLGYSTLTDLSVYQEAILPSDSLLGMKYLMSKKEVTGYEKMENIPEENGKSVYSNPYALGLGIGADEKIQESIESADPFAFQNMLYSNLLGRNVEIFRKAQCQTGISENLLTLTVEQGEAEDILYGYVDSWIRDLKLYVDGNYRCNYATWLSYKVFSAGYGNQAHTIVLENYTGTEQEMFPYFYYLDMDLFEEVIQELRTREMDTQVFEDGYVKGTYTAQEEGYLLLTIPYDQGWKAFVNGQQVEITDGANALSVIPVEEGENQIELRYTLPGLKTGALLSALGIILFAGLCGLERYMERKKKDEESKKTVGGK